MITKFKIYEQFVNEYVEDSGLNTYWSDGDTTIYFKDILKYLDEQKVPIQMVDPKELKNLLIKTKRDPNRVEKADLQYPLIVSMVNGEYKSILDGQHRLFKALKYNLDKIKIRVLNINSTPDNYKKVFEDTDLKGKMVNVDYKIFHQDWKEKPLALVTDFKIHKMEGNYIEVIGKGYEYVNLKDYGLTDEYKDRKKKGWVAFDDYKEKKVRKFPKKSVKDGEKRIKVYFDN